MLRQVWQLNKTKKATLTLISGFSVAFKLLSMALLRGCQAEQGRIKTCLSDFSAHAIFYKTIAVEEHHEEHGTAHGCIDFVVVVVIS